jgi:Cell division protein FtsI/penicillin-binding protein 2
MKKRSELSNVKFNALFIIVGLLFFVGIIARTAQLSLSEEIDDINLQQFAANRTIRNETLYAKRGSIFDVKGNILAQNVSSYTLLAYVNPSRTTDPNKPMHVVDAEYTAEQLSTVLNISKEDILKQLVKIEANPKLYQVEFGTKAKGLSELTKDKIAALSLPGIDFIATQKRYYPYGNFLSYTLGYAKFQTVTNEDGVKEEVLVGEMGIEKSSNEKLNGTNGYRFYQKDRKGYKIAGTNEVTVDAMDGNDLYLTIDSNIQLFVEQAFSKVYEEYGYEWMTAMVMDAKTGAILASATSPSFNPNIKDITNYYDYNVSNPYEPGSTMKIFSYMAAMEKGVYNGEEKYMSGTYVTKDGTEIGDHDRKGWGMISYDQGFAFSSNIAVVNLLNKYVGASYLKEYYKKLGFGSKTGIELPGESAGKIEFKYETEVYNAGFGQGILTTPVQNLKALTAISNNGILLKPYIIDKIVDSNTGEVIYKGEKQELERVASEKTVNKMKELMRSVASGSVATSTGYFYYMDGYDLIAKTGTAQVANKNGIGYSNSDVIKGFSGMFPGEDPEVIIYLAVKNPGSVGGTALMKSVIQEITKDVSKYLNIYDDSDSSKIEYKSYVMENYINKKTSDVINTLNNHKLNYLVIGDGNVVIDQYPKAKDIVSELDKVIIVTNSSNITMPSLIGYSAKDLYALLNKLNIDYDVEGIGYVTEQSIEAGTIINDKSKVKVKLELKNQIKSE